VSAMRLRGCCTSELETALRRGDDARIVSLHTVGVKGNKAYISPGSGRLRCHHALEFLDSPSHGNKKICHKRQFRAPSRGLRYALFRSNRDDQLRL